MQKNNQRASNSKLLMTQPGKKEPEMPPPPTTACVTDVASLESGQLLCSPGLNPPIDIDVSGPTQIPSQDSAASLATEPEKGCQEARNRKVNCLPRVSLDKGPAGVHHKRKRPSPPEVQQYFYQVNWPQEVLQKWAKEKEDKKKTTLSVDINQDAAAAAASRRSALDPALGGQNFVCEKPEDKGALGMPQNRQKWNSVS